MRDHTANSNHGILADSDAAEDGTAGTDAGPPLDDSGRELPCRVFGMRIAVIGEGHVRADEYIVFQRDAIPYLHTILDGDIITDNRDELLAAGRRIFGISVY